MAHNRVHKVLQDMGRSFIQTVTRGPIFVPTPKGMGTTKALARAKRKTKTQRKNTGFIVRALNDLAGGSLPKRIERGAVIQHKNFKTKARNASRTAGEKLRRGR